MRKNIKGNLWFWGMLFALVGLIVLVTFTWFRRVETPQPSEPATLVAQVTEAGSPFNTPTPVILTDLPLATLADEPTETLEPTPEPKPYHRQPGTPVYTRAFAHAAEGCTWIGVAGQVFQQDGRAASDVAILVTGNINGQWHERAVVVGSESVYGPGGYEIQLTQRLPASTTSFIIQLFDLQSQPLSIPIVVRVPDNCDQNLALVNFRAGSADWKKFFLPIASNQIEP